MMKNCLLICLLILLNSCIQLQEKEFKLEYTCASCKETLENKLLIEIEGVHHSVLNTDSGILRLKVDPRKFDLECLFHFLEEEGFSRQHDRPICCKSPNSSSYITNIGE